MLTPILSNERADELQSIIRNSKKAIVCGHRSPDGDALGSCLAWAGFLKRAGIDTLVILPNPYPDFLQWLPGCPDIVFYERHKDKAGQALSQADLICCLDFNEPKRLGEMGTEIENSKATIITIDHHLNPDLSLPKMVISHTEMCATCEIVFRLIHQLGGFNDVTKADAMALYTGMMTDTGGFTYNSNSPELYEIISLLLTKGIDKDKIYRNVFHSYSQYRLRLTGYILYAKLRFLADGKASVFTISRDEMKRFHFIRGDAEGLVNMPLQVKGLKLSISLREDTEKDVVRVSLRSVGNFPCNKMAEEFFNGGGHLNASGGELPFPLSKAVETAEKAIEAYSMLL